MTGQLIPGQVFGQFGGSVSGPIIKDHTFFFLDYQGTRQRLGGEPVADGTDRRLPATPAFCRRAEQTAI